MKSRILQNLELCPIRLSLAEFAHKSAHKSTLPRSTLNPVGPRDEGVARLRGCRGIEGVPARLGPGPHYRVFPRKRTGHESKSPTGPRLLNTRCSRGRESAGGWLRCVSHLAGSGENAQGLQPGRTVTSLGPQEGGRSGWLEGDRSDVLYGEPNIEMAIIRTKA